MLTAESQIHIYDTNVPPRHSIWDGGAMGDGLGGGETGAEGGGKTVREKRGAGSVMRKAEREAAIGADSICVVYMNCRFSHAPAVEAAIIKSSKETKVSHEKGRLR